MNLSSIVNLDLLLNPYNWIVVILMLTIAVYGLTLLTGSLDQVGGFLNQT